MFTFLTPPSHPVAVTGNVNGNDHCDNRSEDSSELDPQQILAGFKVSAYDRVSSTLYAFLVLASGFALLLFLMWLTNQTYFSPTPTAVSLPEFEGGPQTPPGVANDAEQMGLEEVATRPESAEATTLETLRDALSSIASSLDSVDSALNNSTNGSQLGGSKIYAPRKGDPLVKPPWERWELRYSATSRNTYAEQLDYFQIELGAIGGGISFVDYAKSFTKPQPERRQGRGGEEKRVYFSFAGKKGLLYTWDRELLQASGIPMQGRTALQFIPRDLVGELLQLEITAMKPRKLSQIEKTVFAVRRKGREYEFYVAEQQFRPAVPSPEE